MFTEPDDVLDKFNQGPSQLARPVMEKVDTSGDEFEPQKVENPVKEDLSNGEGLCV